MEQKIAIPSPDGKVIYGTLNTQENREALTIFVHGLTDHQNNHLFYNAAKFFPQHGFSTFRFDLYSWKENARKLKECTLQTHAGDLNTVLNYFKEKYSRIYLIGHSLGCPTILLSDIQAVRAIVFWDPSYEFNEFMPTISKFDKELGVHLLDGAYEIIIREKMYQSLTEDFPDCFKLVKELKKPIKIIAAGSGLLNDGAKRYFESVENKKEFVIIDNATHCFDEEGTEEQLFEETVSWLNQF